MVAQAPLQSQTSHSHVARRVSRQVKIHACLMLALAIVFATFFQVSKHQPALSQVNTFADDPYDAVGSFAVQFALFAALLSMLRAFRPYPSDDALLERRALLMRSEVVVCLSVVVTMLTDGITLVRYRSLWIGSSAGHILAGLVVGIAALAILLAWRVYASGTAGLGPTSPVNRTRLGVAIGLSLLSALVFSVYPPAFDHGYGGAILTVILSLVLFFAMMWAWTIATTPAPSASSDDALDDLAAPIRLLNPHLHLAGVARPLVSAWRAVSGSALVRSLVNWLNPRKHAWNAVLLIGLLMGAYLAFAEFSGGPLPRAYQIIRVTLVFVGLECVGVLVGYAFFSAPLRLVRHDTPDDAPSQQG